jgi:diketogulonate reductase-like aldo/keto reductase|tara:strand:- start:483 stop:683 length:201 start_codon:yes stop_codon:yes gene_type:complete
MKDIGSGHKSTPSQVALNWLIKRDTLPIPGVKSALQAADNAAAMQWDLTESEFDALNRATIDFLPD